MSELDDGPLELTEYQAFADWVTAALARNPERTIARMVRVFPESRLRQARQALSRTPDSLAPEPWPEPDEPGASWFCDWCGRTEPEGGLTRVYPPPERRATIFETVPGTLELRLAPAPEPGAEADGDNHPHCRDEAACYRERDSRLPEWRRHQYPKYRVTLAGLRVLARQKQEARDLLACAQAAGCAIAAWTELQDQLGELEPRQDDVVALSAYSGTEPFSWAISAEAADPNWLHTMRAPWNRVHTHGYQVAQYGYPHLPAAGAVQEATATARAGRPLRKPLARLPVRKVRRRIRLR